MRRLTLPTVLMLLLALPSVAGAATRQIIRGAGFGHGVGMSQYGAYGYARHGYDYRQILAHYYQGTSLSKSGGDVRILLQTGGGSATFTGATEGGGHKLNPAKTYRVKLKGLSEIVLFDPKGKQLGHFSQPVDVTNSSSGLVRLNGRAINGMYAGHYRGALEFRPSPFRGLAVVNVASLEDYVKGVVPGEMPSSWSPAALQAQAVAARSYALATDAGGPVFDQYPDTRSQVYKGADGEAASSNAAVDATAGQVLRYQGKIATTYFFSTSGGETEDVENVFYGAQPEPYLTGVDDPYDNISPKHRWNITLTTSSLQHRLRSLVRGKLRGVKIVQRGVSPRVVWASVVGSRGSVRVRGATLRSQLGLLDTWFSFNRFTSKTKPGVPPTPPTPPTTPTTPGGGVSPGGGAASAGVFAQAAGRPNFFTKPGKPGKPARVYGSIWPAPKHSLARIQKLGRDGAWHTVGHTRLDKRGRYDAPVKGHGKFRVVVQGLVGPTTFVRSP